MTQDWLFRSLAIWVLCAACATARPDGGANGPAPDSLDAWVSANPEAAHDLANWARVNIRTQRLLSRWERDEPDVTRDFVLWTLREPARTIDVFVNSHRHGPVLNEIVLQYPSSLERLRTWCRQHPMAAEALVRYPRPFEWVGAHLYRL